MSIANRQPESTTWIECLRDTSLQPSAFRIYAAIVHLNSQGVTEIPIPLLQQMTGVGSRTAYHALRELEKRNYILRQLRGRRAPLLVARVEVDSQTEENQKDSGKQKTPSPVHTIRKKILNTKEAVARIQQRFARLVIPPSSYLSHKRVLIYQTAHMLKLAYAKVILAILLADYYKTVNSNYVVRFAGGWVAKMALLPEDKIILPNGFADFLETRLDQIEREGHEERMPLLSLDQEPTAHRLMATATSVQCPRCACPLADLAAIRDHERSCIVRAGPIGEFCPECRRFIIESAADKEFHRMTCRGAGLWPAERLSTPGL